MICMTQVSNRTMLELCTNYKGVGNNWKYIKCNLNITIEDKKIKINPFQKIKII